MRQLAEKNLPQGQIRRVQLAAKLFYYLLLRYLIFLDNLYCFIFRLFIIALFIFLNNLIFL